MLKYLLFIFLLTTGAAFAQGGAVTDTTLTGAPIGSGYNLQDSQLFIAASASLNATAYPFTISFDAAVPRTGVSAGTNNFFLLGGVPLTGTASQGFDVRINTGTNVDSAGRLQAFVRNATNAAPFCSQSGVGTPQVGQICWRGFPPATANAPVVDGNRHHYCVVWTATSGKLYYDGILRDQTTNIATLTMATNIWRIGTNFSTGAGAAPTLWDMRVYNKALTPNQCVNIHRLQQAGKIPDSSSGDLNTGLILSLPLNNCVSTLPLVTCADSSGNGNDATNDKAPPVVTILTPSPSGVSGNVSVTASCVDPSPGLSCQKICYLIDGGAFSPTCPTAAPYSFTLDTTKIVDGVHQLSAIGFNATGVQGFSANVALTTTNGVTVTSYFFDGTAGDDTKDCKSVPNACKTMAKLQTTVLKGGDTVSFKVNTPFTALTPYTLQAGGGLGSATQNFFPSSGTLTFTTYGGGVCNPFTLTSTNCATINMGAGQSSLIIANNPTNVTFENMFLTGGASSLAVFCGQAGGNGIEIESSLLSSNITIQNNFVKDFSCNINAQAALSQVGIINNLVVADNVVTNTAFANPGGLTGIHYGNGASGHIFGNLVYNIGGTASSDQGNCIQVANYFTTPGPSAQTLIEYNVGHDFSGNQAAGGGGICIYTFRSFNTVFQFNEAYNGTPYNPALIGFVFDFDGFDMDNGTNTSIMQYNYAHDNPIEGGFLLCIFAGGGQNWANNQVRYNIAENNAIGVPYCTGNNGTNSYVFNNTIYANLNRVSGVPLGTLGDIMGSCSSGTSGQPYDIVFANNLCIHDGPNDHALWGSNNINTTNYRASNNAYWSVNGLALGYIWLGTLYPDIPTLQAAVPGAEANSLYFTPTTIPATPSISGSPPFGQCWVDGTTTPPAGPQPCPAGYQLSPGSPLIGVGLDINATYGIDPGSRDYWGNAIPNGVGTGFNIGADGGHH